MVILFFWWLASTVAFHVSTISCSSLIATSRWYALPKLHSMVMSGEKDSFHVRLVVIMPTDDEIEKGVEHLVHDYTTLVLTGAGIPRGIPIPWNGPVEQSFLMSCRKFVDFFTNRKMRDNGMIAEDYVPGWKPFSFPTWNGENWQNHHNTHLFHLSYGRVGNISKPWTGYRENPHFLEEIQAAWRDFLAHPPKFKGEFDRWIKAREKQWADVPSIKVLNLNFR